MTFSLKPSAAQRESLMRLADNLAIGIVVVLPWSTSATIILICIWALTVFPTIEPQELKEEMTRPASYLPVALFVFAAIGMLWAGVTMKERINGVDSYLKLLTIPLFMIQFRRSGRGHHVLAAFLISSVLLLILSGISMVQPKIGGWHWTKTHGVPVKDYIAQSAVFTIAAFGCLYLAIDAFRARQQMWGAALVALGVLFLADMVFVVTSRTALFTIPFLLVLLGFRQFGWKGTLASVAVCVVASAVIWAASPNVRERVGSLLVEVQRQQTENFETPAGSRLNYWRRSVEAIKDAPIFGHGTGSIRETFKKSATGEGASALVPVNPHNQTLAVAIQLGIAGALLLFAMWFAHLALFFRGAGIAAWAGLLVAAQNVLGCLANSHLFDFTHGWIYCIGVGICGGMVMRQGAPYSFFASPGKVATARP
jgi:O-antigen ligase